MLSGTQEPLEQISKDVWHLQRLLVELHGPPHTYRQITQEWTVIILLPITHMPQSRFRFQTTSSNYYIDHGGRGGGGGGGGANKMHQLEYILSAG